MVNYQEGKIYKIMNDETDEIYIGSTCCSLAKRFGGHKYNYNSYKKNKTNYVTSFKILDYPSSKIILIELFPCNSKEELVAREAYYITLLPCINKKIPLQTQQEYRDKHKDEQKVYRKIYYEEHKEDEKQYREKNKDKHKLYTKNHYEEHKDDYLKRAIKQRENQDDEEAKKYKHDWYEKNKEKNKEDRILKSRKYYEEHKEEIKQKRRDNRINKSNI